MKHALVLSAALVAIASPAQAQEPVAAVWHRLQATSSLEDLHRAAADAGEEAHIADALVRLRRYELTRRRSDALQARQDLERLADQEASAAAHFALGLALARGPDLRFVVGDDPDLYVTSRYSNAAQQAPRALRRALELDPTLHEAAYVLAELALDLGMTQLLMEALTRLEEPERERSARRAELLSRVLAQLGELNGAAEAADEIPRVDGDASLAAYLKAAALLRHRSSEQTGATAYLTGAAALTEASAAAYYDAIAPILAPAERERWRAADLRSRGEWLIRYWDVHAALSGVTVEQRLGEHYRRLASVRRRGRSAFMGAGVGRGGGGVVPDTRALGIADYQKLLVLRHGDLYRDLRVLHCGVEVLEQPIALSPTWFECRQGPRSRMWQSNARFVNARHILERQAAEVAISGTSYDRPFTTYLSVLHELLQFRGADGQTTLVASTALPVSSARELVRDGRLTAKLEFALIDTVRLAVLRQDTLRSFNADPLPDHGWVLLATELSVSPQTAQLYRIGITDPVGTIGRVVGGDVDIRSYAASPSLMLSDLVTGPEDGVPSFVRGTVRLSLAPGREFTSAERFTLYYEVYGLRSGDVYRTEILVRPKPEGIPARGRALVRGSRASIRLNFEETAGESHPIYGVQQLRSVGLGDLQPGTYTLSITVTDARGRSTSGERTLYVAEVAAK